MTHSENIIDVEELLLPFDVNFLTNLDLLYRRYESFDLDSWSADECKNELRRLPDNIKSLVNTLQLPNIYM